MNGNRRLYRSTSNGMIGGVAAGLGNYFNADPTLFRIAFLLLMLFSGGTFLLIYLLMWVLVPTAGSTAADSNQVIQENLDEIRARVRGFAAPGTGNGSGGVSASPAQGNGGTETPTGQAQSQLAPAGTTAQARQGANPMILIGIGLFFLLVNMGFFRGIHWGMWWPVLLIGLGALMLSRRR